MYKTFIDVDTAKSTPEKNRGLHLVEDKQQRSINELFDTLKSLGAVGDINKRAGAYHGDRTTAVKMVEQGQSIVVPDYREPSELVEDYRKKEALLKDIQNNALKMQAQAAKQKAKEAIRAEVIAEEQAKRPPEAVGV